MLAFNDFFIGCQTHVSARYSIEADGRIESQSSSGVLVSTGAGSTGWLSSLFNMTDGISRIFGGTEIPRVELSWEDRRLVWAVREPFRSQHSGADLVAGELQSDDELVIDIVRFGLSFRNLVSARGTAQPNHPNVNPCQPNVPFFRHPERNRCCRGLAAVKIELSRIRNWLAKSETAAPISVLFSHFVLDGIRIRTVGNRKQLFGYDRGDT